MDIIYHCIISQCRGRMFCDYVVCLCMLSACYNHAYMSLWVVWAMCAYMGIIHAQSMWAGRTTLKPRTSCCHQFWSHFLVTDGEKVIIFAEEFSCMCPLDRKGSRMWLVTETNICDGIYFKHGAFTFVHWKHQLKTFILSYPCISGNIQGSEVCVFLKLTKFGQVSSENPFWIKRRNNFPNEFPEHLPIWKKMTWAVIK